MHLDRATDHFLREGTGLGVHEALVVQATSQRDPEPSRSNRCLSWRICNPEEPRTIGKSAELRQERLAFMRSMVFMVNALSELFPEVTK